MRGLRLKRVGLEVAALVAAASLSLPASTYAGAVIVGPVPPSVTRLAVSSGAAGESVTILGSSLEEASEVRFGSASASFTQVSPIKLEATVPPGTGKVFVSVTTPQGTSPTGGYGDSFTYVEPLVTATPPPPEAAPLPAPPPPPADLGQSAPQKLVQTKPMPEEEVWAEGSKHHPKKHKRKPKPKHHRPKTHKNPRH